MRERLYSLLSPIGLILVWEALVRVGVLDSRFFAAPSEVFGRLGEMTASGLLVGDLAISLQRIVLGFVFGAVPAVLLGMLMGLSRPVRALLEPIAAAVYPIPKIAVLPMIIILFGLGETSKVITVGLSVFFLMLLSTAAGVLRVDRKYFDIARNNGASRWQLYRTVAFPAALPSIMTGAQLGMGFALTVIVGTEFLGADRGIGYRIWTAYQVYDIPTVYAGLVVTAALGWLFTLVLQEVERWLVPWRAADQARGFQAETRLDRFFRVWYRAIRPFSFTASTIPVALGGVAAAYVGKFDLGLFLLALVGSVAIHSGTNMANDYYDYLKGADGPASPGPSRLIQEGAVSPRAMLTAALVAFGVGALIGLYLVSVAGTFILWLGVLSILAGFFYTAGPFALGYLGLGELTVALFMGPVIVLGSYFVQTREVSWPVVLLSLPIGFMVAAILHANNLRDIEGDRSVGKRTLAVFLGRPGADYELYVLLIASYAGLAVVISLGIAPLWTVIAFLTLPTALNVAQRAASSVDMQTLDIVLRRTALLHTRFGLLMIAGFVIGLFIH